jgi:flagellar motor switch protein FliN
MPEAVQYEQFDHASPSTGGEQIEVDLRRLSEVAMELSVEIGRASMTVGETLELRPGSIITLERLAGEPVDLLVNGTPIARGEVVVVDEQFGLRVTEVVEGDAGETSPANEDTPSDGDGLAAEG